MQILLVNRVVEIVAPCCGTDAHQYTPDANDDRYMDRVLDRLDDGVQFDQHEDRVMNSPARHIARDAEILAEQKMRRVTGLLMTVNAVLFSISRPRTLVAMKAASTAPARKTVASPMSTSMR